MQLVAVTVINQSWSIAGHEDMTVFTWHYVLLCISRAQRRTLYAGLPLHRQVVPRALHKFIPAQVLFNNPTNTHGFPFLSSYYNSAFWFIYMRFLIGTHTHIHIHACACRRAHTEHLMCPNLEIRVCYWQGCNVIRSHFPLSALHTALRFLCFVPILKRPTDFLLLVMKHTTYALTRALSSPPFTTGFRSQLIFFFSG